MTCVPQEFLLPWAPSVNRYYRHVGSRVLISRDGRRYRERILAILREKKFEKYKSEIEVEIQLYPPDRRRRDVDNSLKCLLDALTAAGVYEDDSLIKKLTVTKYSPIPPDGAIHIKLQKYNNQIEKR